MIIFKPGRPSTEHLQEKRPTNHWDAIDLVWKYRHALGSGFIDDMAQWHRWGALDQEEFYYAMSGPLKGQELRLVAVMPPSDAAILHYYHPDIKRDRKEFYKFLERHPEYSAVGRRKK